MTFRTANMQTLNWNVVKLREREGQRGDLGRSLKGPKIYCVCYPNTLLYMVLDHLWAKKGHNFGQKLKFSIFQKFTFLAVLRGFGGPIEIPIQVL